MLKVRDLTVLHPTGEEILGVSFQVPKGQVTAVVGSNSSGKSLLGRSIADPAIERKGEVMVNHLNSALEGEKSKFHLGFSPAMPVLEEHLTGFEWLDFIGSVFGLSPAERSKRIIELAKDFGLSEQIYRLNELLSPGERKKLSLAASIIHHPTVIIWDEPTALLDPTGQELVRHYIKRLTDDKRALLLITNDLPLAEEVAEEIIVIDDGNIVMSGTLSELKNQTGSKSKDLAEILRGS